MSKAFVSWNENGLVVSARWQSERGAPAPRQIRVVDDTLSAGKALDLADKQIGMLWRGDFQNARQLLRALARRFEKRLENEGFDSSDRSPVALFEHHRQVQARRAHILAMILVPVEVGYSIPLARAPEIGVACEEAYGVFQEPFLISLREISGVVGAHQWRKNGVLIKELGGRIHPYYGVYSPVRGEYTQLVASAPLPQGGTAFDIGTGTGVLAVLLARRGVNKVIATDQDDRAIQCARENLQRLGFAQQVEVVKADLFPPGRATLVVCNPPWIPAEPTSPLEYAVYDPGSQMLRGFLSGLAQHLEPQGEGWLILSDLAEHLGLRTRAELLEWIEQGGLRVERRLDIQPEHSKAKNSDDPLFFARSKEVTSLWCLTLA